MPPKKADTPPQNIEVGDTVLAKIKGYPAWPARVIDPETAPPKVKRERPKGTKTTFYCVCFYPKGDHAWLVIKDLTKLTPKDIEMVIADGSKAKKGELHSAYKVALDPSEWEAQRAVTIKEAEDDAVDELSEDGDSSGKTKKRKRTSDAADDKKKATKKTNVKATKTKTEPKTKKRGKKSSELIPESEDDGEKKDDERPSKKNKGDDEEEDEEPMSEDAKNVKMWRHDLQRIFLSKGGSIKVEDMEKASTTLKTVEDFTPKLTVQLLSSSKIGKVLKKITSLPGDAIPNGDEFKIRERGNKLMADWAKLAGAPLANGDAAAPISEPAPTAVNGNSEAKMDVDAPVVENGHVDVPETVEAPTVPVADADVDMKVDEPTAPATEPVVA